MAIKFASQSETALLDKMLASSISWVCRLFKTNVAIDDAVTVASFVEANFGGYSQQPMMSPFPASATNAAGKAETQYPGPPSAQLTFTRNTNLGTPNHDINNDIFGFYVVDTATNKLIMCELFGGAGTPFPMVNNGDTITLRPTIRLTE